MNADRKSEPETLNACLLIFDDDKQVWNRARSIPADFVELARQGKVGIVPLYSPQAVVGRHRPTIGYRLQIMEIE